MSWASVATAAATSTTLGTVYGITSAASSPFLTAIGYQAGASTSGSSNCAYGYQSLYTNTSGASNTAYGTFSLTLSTASQNCAFGAQAMAANTTGAGGSAFGFQALFTNTTSNNNSAFGYTALNLATGNSNTAVGNASGAAISTGSRNVSLGATSNGNGTTGSDNVCIGPFTNLSAAGDSNSIVIGNAGGSTLTGKGGSTGFISPGGGAMYQGNNSAAWSVTSDQRLKKNIVDNNIGLDAINAVQVRNFEYRLPEEVNSELKPSDAIEKTGIQLGVIAQELQTVLPDCVKQESTGVLSVDSDPLTWYMVNAIKQLSAALDAANARIAALEAK
jgi:hypothetical protein